MLSLLSHPELVGGWLLQNLAWAALWAGAGACWRMIASLLAALPRVVLPRVFHVGQHPRNRLVRRTASHEGPGLSVSLHPEAWTCIAQLGGHPTWALVRRDGRCGQFLDVLALRGKPREAVLHALIAAGVLAVEPRFVVRSFDDELDSSLESLCGTMAEALGEADLEPSDLLPRPRRQTNGDIVLTRVVHGQSVRQRAVPVPTEALRQWYGAHFSDRLCDLHAFDMALAWAVAHFTALDGLWWLETLAPDQYSAPRGVITPRALAAWAATPATAEDSDDAPLARVRGKALLTLTV